METRSGGFRVSTVNDTVSVWCRYLLQDPGPDSLPDEPPPEGETRPGDPDRGEGSRCEVRSPRLSVSGFNET